MNPHRILFIILTIFCTATTVLAQKWFPGGATWSYATRSVSGSGNVKIQVIKDTVVIGVPCKLLNQIAYKKASFFSNIIDTFYEPNLYAWERNDSVYFLQKDTFILVYDFGLHVGDTSSRTAFSIDTGVITAGCTGQLHPKYYVQSLDSFTINGQVLKYYIDTINEPASPNPFKIIERIGSSEFLILQVYCGINLQLPYLLCYSDTIIGTYRAVPGVSCNPFAPDSSLIVTLGGNRIVCPGTVDTLYPYVSGGTPTYTYNWSSTGAAILSCDTCARPYVIIDGAATIKVTVTDAEGRQDVSTQSFTTGNGSISISSSGPATLCSGESLILSVASGYATYDWSNGSTGSSISVTQSGGYTVTVTTNSNCTSTGSLSVNFIVPPSAESIIGNTAITPFQSYPYAVNQVSGITYNWVILGGVIQTGQGTNSITVLWGGTGPYLVTLNQTLSANCSTQSSLPVLSSGIQELGSDVFDIYAYYSGGQNIIKLNSQVINTYELRLFEISGRLVLDKPKVSTEETVLPITLAKGVYIVEVYLSNGIVKKIKAVVR